MSIFDKCGRFTEAKEAEAVGLYPFYHAIEEVDGTRMRMAGEWKLMAGSNNYLALADHPEVLEASTAALRRLGSGCTGSRLLNGTLHLHEELEHRLAEFLSKPAALVFTTGYQTNLGILGALVGRKDHVFLDRLDHACILDGARLGHGTIHRYDHGHLDRLDSLLGEAPDPAGKLVATDGVFSMDGDIVDLPEIVEIADRHGAQILLDDAHALGVLGPTGAGTAEHFALTEDVDLIMATFSKSLASVGGVVAGPADVVHFLRHWARALVYSAAMPPASVAGALKALEILQREPERRERLWAATRRLAAGLADAGFDTFETETPIVPVRVGDHMTALAFWRKLFDAGFYVNAVVPPGVPAGSTRLRVSLTAAHTPEDVDRLLEAFVTVRAELGKRGEHPALSG